MPRTRTPTPIHGIKTPDSATAVPPDDTGSRLSVPPPLPAPPPVIESAVPTERTVAIQHLAATCEKRRFRPSRTRDCASGNSEASARPRSVTVAAYTGIGVAGARPTSWLPIGTTTALVAWSHCSLSLMVIATSGATTAVLDAFASVIALDPTA